MSTYVNLKLNVHLLNVFTKVVSTKVMFTAFQPSWTVCDTLNVHVKLSVFFSFSFFFPFNNTKLKVKWVGDLFCCSQLFVSMLEDS